jgi:hypothetical protein
MKGRERVCKVRIRKAGWELEDQGRGRAEGEQYRLVLRGPGDAMMTVDAATRPRAYRAAARLTSKVARDVGAV